MTKFIFPAPRIKNIRCGLVLAVVFTAASGSRPKAPELTSVASGWLRTMQTRAWSART